MANFRANMEAIMKEQVTADEAQNMMPTWAKDAADKFFADVAQHDSVYHANLICAQGHADYNDIIGSLPVGRQASILNQNSMYVRNEAFKGKCSDQQWRNKVACEAEGTCSDTAYNNNESGCTGAGETWTTAGNTWTVTGKYFIIRGGVIYSFGVNREAFNLAYHQIVKDTANKALAHHQSLSPTGKRADRIVKITNEYDADTQTFSLDPSATYTAGDLADPINLETAYQPRASKLGTL